MLLSKYLELLNLPKSLIKILLHDESILLLSIMKNVYYEMKTNGSNMNFEFNMVPLSFTFLNNSFSLEIGITALMI